MAAVAFEHPGHDSAGQQDRRFEIDPKCVDEVGLGCLVEPPDDVDAGVVDEDVDRPEFGLGPLDQPGPIVGDRDVTDGGDRLHAHRLDLVAHRLELVRRPSGQRQVHAFLGECLRDVHTDAA